MVYLKAYAVLLDGVAAHLALSIRDMPNLGCQPGRYGTRVNSIAGRRAASQKVRVVFFPIPDDIAVVSKLANSPVQGLLLPAVSR